MLVAFVTISNASVIIAINNTGANNPVSIDTPKNMEFWSNGYWCRVFF